MMRLLIDCDVLLDVALRREPHFEHSSQILDWAESHPGRAAIAWHSIANLIYLCKGNSKKFVSELIDFIEIPEAGTDAMRFALELGMKDVEDAMQVAVADCFNAQVIATRNTKDYAKSPIKAMKPDAMAALLRE